MFGNSRFRDGVRFPSDVAGHPAGTPGPVTTYRVSPEEIEARFGPSRWTRKPKPPALPDPKPEEEAAEVGTQTERPRSGDPGPGQVVAELIRSASTPGILPAPHFVMGGGGIRVADLAAKAQALLLLLGEDAVMLVEDGVLVVRG